MKKYIKYVVIGLVAAGLISGGIFLFIKNQNASSSQEMAQKAIDYINKNLLASGMAASLVDVVEESGVYKFKLKIGENEYNSYITKDGKLLWPEDAINIGATSTAQTSQTGQESPKSDKVDVKLFVMSYCPYGLQAEKMYLPVYNLLKDKAEMGIYFVNYAMHEKQELDENLTQYCIQNNEKEKYSAYLGCFVKAGDSAGCLSEAGINKSKLNSCVSETDSQYGVTAGYNDKSTWLSGQYPAFKVNDDLNQIYGVQGSPTVVINDTVVEVPNRSPEAFKKIVCNAFNTAPEECSQTLSAEAASPGLGESANSNGDSSGSCE